MKISQLKLNPNNPRLIKDDKFKKLVTSLREFPEMMAKRPMVCVTDTDGKLYPLGGNMRLKALQELKYKEIPDSWVMLADEWSEEKRKEFTIKDNVSFGEWDWDRLANVWNVEELTEWSVDIPNFETDNDINFRPNLEPTTNFRPNLEPTTNYSDVTKEQIQKEAERLAKQMLSSRELTDVICPECGATFQID